MQEVDLGRGVVYLIDAQRRVVTTRYVDGRECSAWREPTEENLREAADQGYDATIGGVWRSLVEHEALHTTIGRAIFGGESAVLRSAAGEGTVLYHDRLHEEALVIAAQHWLNTGSLALVWWPHMRLLPAVRATRDLLARASGPVRPGAGSVFNSGAGERL